MRGKNKRRSVAERKKRPAIDGRTLSSLRMRFGVTRSSKKYTITILGFTSPLPVVDGAEGYLQGNPGKLLGSRQTVCHIFIRERQASGFTICRNFYVYKEDARGLVYYWICARREAVAFFFRQMRNTWCWFDCLDK